MTRLSAVAAGIRRDHLFDPVIAGFGDQAGLADLIARSLLIVIIGLVLVIHAFFQRRAGQAADALGSSPWVEGHGTVGP